MDRFWLDAWPRFLRLPSHVKPAQQSIPCLEPQRLFGRFSVWVDSGPRFQRRCTVQVLVRPDRVVPEREQFQRMAQLRLVRHAPVIQPVFQRPEHSFHSAVLPRATRRCPLVPDAKQPQTRGKHLPGKDAFVVAAQRPGFAVAADGQAQVPQQGPCTLVCRNLQPQQPPRAVVDHAQDGVDVPIGILLAGQVDGPDCIGSRGERRLAFDLSALLFNQVPVLPQHLGHMRFAHGFTLGRMAAVEHVHYLPTAHMRHVRLQPDDLPFHPRRLAPGAAGRWCRRLAALAMGRG